MNVAPADGYTALALAVIKRTLDDTDPGVPRATRDKALHFLAGGPALVVCSRGRAARDDQSAVRRF